MTQETAHMPLDERGLEAALKVFEADHGENSEAYLSAAIRDYLQTAAADVSGLVERLNAIDEAAMYEAPATTEATIEEAASTIQTLSASNAALEAENERLRKEREACIAEAANYCWMRYKGRYPLNLHSPAVFTSHEHQCIEEHIRAALSAPKGGQDHG